MHEWEKHFQATSNSNDEMDGMQTGRSSGELGDRSTRWWFVQMMEDKVPFISKSYYSVSTGATCTSIFIPMYLDGEIRLQTQTGTLLRRNLH